jgi:predicted RNA-binding Zn ribbon-like protein
MPSLVVWVERIRQWCLMPPGCCNGIVHLNPYGHDVVAFAVDLANAPPASVADLENRCLAAELVLAKPVDTTDLAAVEEFLHEWTAVVDAPTDAVRAERLNTLLATWTAHPRLTDHDGVWHLHYRDEGLPPSAVVAAIVTAGTALHLVGRGMGRLGRCDDGGCGRIYADTSRGGRQRYCSPACANRDAVRRHRARATARA